MSALVFSLTDSNGKTLVCLNREVYHTSRMQRVSCVRFSGDSTYVLSGSDETNIRWVQCDDLTA